MTWVRSQGGEHSYPLQYSCLENPMDRGAWQAAVHGVTKSLMLLSRQGDIFDYSDWCGRA